MGFDWNLTIQVYLDPTTGLPWVWSPDGDLRKVPFNPEVWRLPEKFREFAIMRGHHLRHYTRAVEIEEDRFQADAATLIHYFPKWGDIKDAEVWADYDWDEIKHNLFYECLAWCAVKGSYGASWSY